MALLRTAGGWGSSEVHSGRGSGVLLRTTSEVAALQQIKEQLEAQQSRAPVRCARFSIDRRSRVALRRPTPACKRPEVKLAGAGRGPKPPRWPVFSLKHR